MSKTCWFILTVLWLMTFAWLLYNNTGVHRILAETEVRIEAQCRTFAECHVSDDGITCYAIDTNDEVLVSKWHEGDAGPTYGDIDAFCRELVIKRLSI